MKKTTIKNKSALWISLLVSYQEDGYKKLISHHIV